MNEEKRLAEIRERCDEAKKWAAGCDRTNRGCQVPQIGKILNTDVPFLLSKIDRSTNSFAETNAAVEFIRELRSDDSGDWGDIMFRIDEWMEQHGLNDSGTEAADEQ